MAGGKSHRSLISNRVRKSKHVQREAGTTAAYQHRRVHLDLGLKGLIAERKHAEERVRLHLSGLTEETQQILLDNQVRSDDYVMDEGFVIEQTHGECDSKGATADTWEDEPDNEVFKYALRDITGSEWKGRWYRKNYSWRTRKVQENAAWDELVEPLADAVLRWKHSQVQPLPQNTSGLPPGTEDRQETYEYTLFVYDIFSLQDELTIFRPATSTCPALDLAAHGYIAKTPTKPTVAVSIKTLELLHRLRKRKASFSMEAFAKVVCDYYSIPFRRFLRSVIADTFEIYLRIANAIESRITKKLGWDLPDWRVKNACRACCYKLNDEPSMRFSRMLCMDGNNSLKRMATMGERVVADSRAFEDSDYYLPSGFVDKFANEIRSRKGPQVKTKRQQDASDGDDSDDEADRHLIEGDPTDGMQEINRELQPPANEDSSTLRTEGLPSLDVDVRKASTIKAVAACVKNWKAASAEELKKMWSIFAECGIFASACRHGLILWIIDMVRSGELAKYPLAIMAKVLEVLEPDALCGYDIGCSFDSTVTHSSLAAAFKEKNTSMCVNAFHGYTHCYQCQLHYHPNVINGVGLEDLETLERVFSASNQLASVTRYASPYRRRLFIDAYFKQWDEDKYLNTGTFILNNYVQALDIIERDSAALQGAKESLGITDEDMDQWTGEEAEFFAKLGDEQPYNMHEVVYVELLQELKDAESMRSRASMHFNTFVPVSDVEAYEKQVSATRKLETERRHTIEKHERISLELCSLEVQLGISPGERWTPAHPKYQEAVKFVTERKYRRALDKLQKLVIQRLFELHKLNLAQTGYKMRTHLSKSLQVRCKTIRKAVTAYNSAAAALVPPREPLEWSNVSHYGFLQEFNLLQDTHNDIRSRRWTEPAVRETMKLRQRLDRAREEIQRCNVEVRRLHTAIRDERNLLQQVLADLCANDDPLHAAFQDFATRRTRINNSLLRRVYEVYNLRGFTGIKGPGARLGTTPVDIEQVDNEDPQPGDESSDEEEDEDLQGDLGGIVDYIGNLQIS